MRRLLVTGGAGFIGSMLVRVLMERGDEVRVIDDLSSGRAENLEGVDGVELLVGSILDEALIARAMRDVDWVFHLACRGVRHSIHAPVENHEVNATGTLRLLEAARSAEAARFVYTSTSEVYGTAVRVPMDEDHPTWPHTVYGGSKLAGEAYVRAYHRIYGMPTVVIRPFNTYGPRSHHEGDSGEVIPKFIVRAMNGKPPVIFGDGTQTRDFTYVEDTARGIVELGDADGAIGATVNLGSGAEISVKDLAALILRVTDRQDLGTAPAPARPGDVLRLIADSRKATRLIGWAPAVGLEEGIGRLLAWHREQGTDWERALEDDVERNWEVSTP